jgi:ubiquinone/menaquinone biosynthesis C-methylase UbiE
MQAMMDYRLSHLASDKGKLYDQPFCDYGWRQYLWQREKQTLRKILYDFFAFEPVSCLDFACGTGRILEFLNHRVNTCTGVDISASMLSLCRKKLPEVSLIEGDVTQDDILKGREFNLITAFRFFANAQQSLRKEVLLALHRHLAKDGILVFNNHRNRSNPLFATARLMGKQLNTLSHDEIMTLIDEAGFTLIRVYCTGVLPGLDKRRPSSPESWYYGTDWLAEKLVIGRWLGQNLIYVCLKK